MKIAALSVAAILFIGAAFAETAPRTWTSRKGTAITAKLVEVKGDDVLLQTTDGKQLAIKLALLSGADQQYIQSQTGAAKPAEAPAASTPEASAAKDPGGLWEAGKISKDIPTAKDAQWTYLLYVPKSFNPERKWPVLFIVSHTGGTPEELQLYVPGAELCGWILVISRQARASFFGNEDAVAATVEDVQKRLPVNPKGLFVAGHFSGSLSAFWLATTHADPLLAGVLTINGNATEPDKVPAKIPVYGLCGSNSMGRWGVACVFRDLKTPVKHLRAYIGETTLPDADPITEGMAWLNQVYLQGSGAASGQEKAVFEKRLQQEITRAADAQPEHAYELAQTLSTGANGMPTQGFNPALHTLLNNPRVKRYATGQKDVGDFIKKHFATDPLAYYNPAANGTKAAKQDAEKFALTYKDSYLEDLFKHLGQEAK